MFAFDARFTVLAVFCCISAQWLLPSLSAHGAVISRKSLSSTSPFQLAANDPSSPSQHVFPWSHRFHKVRSTNPIQQLADAMFSRIKHGRQKRSHKSILIPTGHGKGYLAHRRREAGTPQWVTGYGNSTNGTMSTQSLCTAGTVRIESSSDHVGGWSLLYKNGTIIASKDSATLFCMVQIPTTPNGVSLSVHDNKTSQDYCATYDPSPNKPEPMTMQRCDNFGGSKSARSDADERSQIFMYNQTSNELRPTWNDGSSTAQTASIPSDTTTNSTNGTKSASGLPPSSRSLSSRDDANLQNVTLKWVPDEKVAAADVSENPEDTQISDSTSSAVTTTKTQTVTVFQTGLASSTLSSSSGVPSSSSLNVEVVGGSSASSSVSQSFASSISMMDAPKTFTSSPPTASQSVDAAAIASGIAASASASMSSYSASTSGNIATAADVSSSTASSTASSDPSSSTFVAAVIERAAWVRPEER